MPISDEIIELEPVKKSKLKFIILITVASIMLALAVVFLVLYIIKPDAQVDPKAVKQVEIIDNPLFDSGTLESGEKVYLASVSNEYTFKAVASAEGGATGDINWSISHNDAISGSPKISFVEEEGRTIGIYTFTPNAAFAANYPDTVVTLTARDAYKGEKLASVKMKIVAQQIESFEFGQYYYSLKNSASTSTRRNVSNQTIEVPYSEKIRTVTFTFTPHGEHNKETGEYAQISYNNEDSKIKAESSKTSVAIIQNGGVVQTNKDKAEGSVTFQLQGTGETKITLTDEVSGNQAVLTVNVKTSTAMGIIEEIYVYDTPVTAEFYEQYKDYTSNSQIEKPAKDSKLVLPYGNNVYSYGNILDHVVILPLSIQYDFDKSQLKTDWYNMVDVTVKSNAIRIDTVNGKPSIRTQGVASAADCGVTVTDKSSQSLGASGSIGVNVVAGNGIIDSSVTIGNRSYNNSQINTSNAGSGIAVSKGDSVSYTVKYELTAPKDTDLDDFVEKGLMSIGYGFVIPDGLTVKLGDKSIESGKEYTFTKDELKVTHPVESAGRFNAEATFTVSVQTDKGGKYKFSFNKIASPFGGTYDAAITKEVVLAVTVDPDYVGFIEEGEILKTLRATDDNGIDRYVGRVDVGKVTKSMTTGVWEGELNVHIQHLESGKELWFDPKAFVFANGDDGQSEKNTSWTNLTNTSNSVFIREASTGKILFKNTTSDGSVGYVTVEVKNKSNAVIGSFRVHFYMLDAIASIECENKNVENIQYNADLDSDYYYGNKALTNNFYSVNVFDKSPKPYTNIGDVNISYIVSGTETSLKGTWNDDKTEKSFVCAGDTKVLFKYIKSSKSIIPQTDIFTYAFETGKDVSQIKVTYFMSNEDLHVGDPKSCSRIYNFVRQVDDIQVFTDAEYTKQLPNSGGKVSYPVSSGKTYDLYLSSVVTINKGTANAKDIIIRQVISTKTIARYNRAYFTLPDDRTGLTHVSQIIDGLVSEDNDSNYYNFRFTANLEEQGVKTVIIPIAGVGNRSLELTIQNLSRDIDYIKFTDEQFGSNEITKDYLDGLKALEGFSLGRYNTLAQGEQSLGYYKKDFTVIVLYNSKREGDKQFATATLKFPSYMKVTVNGTEQIANSGAYIDVPLTCGSSIEADLAYIKVNVTIELIKEKITALKQSDLTEQISCTADNASNVNSSLSVTLITGVSQIGHKVVGAESEFNFTNTAAVNITLNGVDDAAVAAASAILRVRYKSFAGDDGFAQWYDTYGEGNADSENDPAGNGFYVNGIMLTQDSVGVKLQKKNQDGSYVDCNESDALRLVIDRNKRLIEITPIVSSLSGADSFAYRLVCTDKSGGELHARDINLDIIIHVDFSVFKITAKTTGSYEVTTNGGAGAQEVDIDVIYNDGKQPSATVVNNAYGKIVGKVVDGDGNVYSGNDISVVKNESNKSFKLVVNNNVLELDKPLYVQLCYTDGDKNIDSNKVEIVLNTDAQFTVTFNGNGGTVSEASRSVRYKNPIGALSDTERTGYTFAGWWTEATGGTQVNAQTVVTANVTYFAHWTQNKVTVIFDGNGGTVSSVSVTVDYGDNIATLPTATRAGHTFAGWWTDETGGTQLTVNDKMTANATYYAHWNIIEYNVTFDANGGIGGSTGKVEYGKSYSLPTSDPTRTDYVFAGWFTAADGGIKITADSDKTVTADITLYAHWNKNEYTVTFDGNGGTVSEASRNVVHGEKVGTLPTPTRTGHAFAGWFTAANDGTQVTAETVVTANATYYAHWTINKVTVIFDGNGGVVSETSRLVDYDTDIGKLPGLERFGYKFDGWFTDKDGGDQVDKTTKFTSDVTVYAQWTERSVTVTLDLNDGDPNKQIINCKQVYAELPTDIQKAGCSFEGWFTDRNGAGKKVNNGDELPDDEEIVLYAHLPSLPTVSVKLEPNGGSTDTSWVDNLECAIYKNATYGSGEWKSGVTGLPTPTKNGYSFAGWWTKNENEGWGTQVVNTTVMNSTDAHSLYARWTANAIIITYDYDGGTGNKPFDTISAGQTENLPALPKASKYGYTFVGWYEVKSTGELAAEAKESLSGISTATTLKAKWNAVNNISLSFDINYTGGTNPTGTTVTFDNEYSNYLPAEPTRTGYTFAGWYTAANGGELIKTNGIDATKVSKAEAHTLHAHWTAKTVTVRFIVDGVTIDDNERSVLYGSVIGALPTASKAQNDFLGWKVNGGSTYSAETVVNTDNGVVVNADGGLTLTLIAQFGVKKYTLTLNANGGNFSQGVETSKEIEYGGSYGTLPTASNINRDGYDFGGWYTAANGGESVNANTTIDVNTIIYAHWTPKSFTVTLDPNGGFFGNWWSQSTRPQTVTVYYDSTYMNLYTSSNTPSKRNGEAFSGWYTAVSGGTKYEESTVVKITGNITLYAQWGNATTYEITFMDGNTSVHTKDVAAGSEYGTLHSLTPKAGYTFDGWFTKNGSNNDWGTQASETSVISGDITLYAKWTANKYVIVLNNDGVITTVDVTYDANYSDYSAFAPTKEGYTLKWLNGTDEFDVSGKVNITATTVLTAQWTANKYYVTFDANGGAFGSENTQVVENTFDAAYVLPDSDPEREGYTFDGWYTMNGSDNDVWGEEVTIDTEFKTNGVVTLYAKWTQDSVTE